MKNKKKRKPKKLDLRRTEDRKIAAKIAESRAFDIGGTIPQRGHPEYRFRRRRRTRHRVRRSSPVPSR